MCLFRFSILCFFCFSSVFFMCCLHYFVVLVLVSSVPGQEITWEDCLRNDLFLPRACDVKPYLNQTQSKRLFHGGRGRKDGSGWPVKRGEDRKNLAPQFKQAVKVI